MLLQKKCLFQLKPVGNLSNTIVSLVSLIPDIFMPLSSSSSGLDNCSGFFDSTDLVNYELAHKKNRKKAAAASETSHMISTAPDALKRTKKLKKKLKSISKKHQQQQQQQQQTQPTPSSQSTLNNSASSGSLASSFSITKTPSANESGQQQQQQQTVDNNSLFTNLSSNTQKIFSFNSSKISSNNNKNNKSLDLDLDAIRRGQDSLLETPTSDPFQYQQSKLDLKSTIFSSKQSTSNSSSSNCSLSQLPKQQYNKSKLFLVFENFFFSILWRRPCGIDWHGMELS